MEREFMHLKLKPLSGKYLLQIILYFATSTDSPPGSLGSRAIKSLSGHVDCQFPTDTAACS